MQTLKQNKYLVWFTGEFSSGETNVRKHVFLVFIRILSSTVRPKFNLKEEKNELKWMLFQREKCTTELEQQHRWS